MNLRPEYNITLAPRYVYREDHGRCEVCDYNIRLDELVEGPDGTTYCPVHWDEKKKDYEVRNEE
jgi:hypothetical protein